MPQIKTNKLTKRYHTGEIDLRAIYDVDLEIQEGELMAITGPSGAGKSTLLHLLGCLDGPTAGDYYLDGINVAFLTSVERAQLRNHKIGFVFQDSLLLNYLNATQNVALPLIYGGVEEAEAHSRAIELLKKVDLEHRLNFFPKQLSGGQLQRVAIARSLAMNPRLLLADEPTGNLDSKNSQNIFNLFLELNKEAGVTVVIVTHEHSLAEQTKRILTIKDGRVESDERL